MNRDVKHAVETAVRLARAYPNYSPKRIADTLKLAQTLAHYATAACNYELSARQRARQENIEKDLRYWYGDAIELSGDPRGYVVKIKLHSGESNHWGGETWGIARLPSDSKPYDPAPAFKPPFAGQSGRSSQRRLPLRPCNGRTRNRLTGLLSTDRGNRLAWEPKCYRWEVTGNENRDSLG